MRQAILVGCVVLAWTSALLVEGGAGSKDGFEQLVVTSSGGFTGRGTGKALAVDAKGKVVAKDAGKEKQSELTADELKQLSKLVTEVNWRAVKKNYMKPGAADFFQDDLRVRVGGKTHETHVSEAVERKNLPADLRALLEYKETLFKKYRP